MSPNEVIELLRQHALELIQFHEKMSSFKELSPSESIVVLNLCLHLIEELAENRWLTSDIIEKYEAGKTPIFSFNLQKMIPAQSEVDLNLPPLDPDFFLNHPDL